mgnify:CR=1 FL=1
MIVCPTTIEAKGLTSQRTAFATSLGSTRRPAGVRFAHLLCEGY